MSERDAPMITCADLPGNCCDSCHDDEDLGFESLLQEPWLHACCSQVRTISDASVDRHDEASVRAFLASLNLPAPPPPGPRLPNPGTYEERDPR